MGLNKVPIYIFLEIVSITTRNFQTDKNSENFSFLKIYILSKLKSAMLSAKTTLDNYEIF